MFITDLERKAEGKSLQTLEDEEEEYEPCPHDELDKRVTQFDEFKENYLNSY
jgi:phosphoribosyl 1,2-cyclic phosphodiesterase